MARARWPRRRRRPSAGVGLVRQTCTGRRALHGDGHRSSGTGPRKTGVDGSHVTGSQGAPAPRIDDTKGRLVNHDLGDERRVRHHRRNDDQPSQPGELFAWGAVRPVRVEDLRVQQCRRQKQGHGASKATHPHARAPHLVRSGHQLCLVQISSRRQGSESLPRKVCRPSQRSGPDRRTSSTRRSMCPCDGTTCAMWR